MRRLCFAIWLVTLCFATAAAGKDLCLLDDDNDALYRFDKVKAPKSSMTAAPLTASGWWMAPRCPSP